MNAIAAEYMIQTLFSAALQLQQNGVGLIGSSPPKPENQKDLEDHTDSARETTTVTNASEKGLK